TAQNTQGVHGIYSIPANFVAEQLDAVFQDLDVKAVKIGMLSDSNIISIIAHKLRQYQPKYLVVDPVMVATSGDLLLEHNAISTLKEQLLPLADVITPNLPEAAALLDCAQPKTEEDMEAMIEQLRQLGAHSVLLKGGHLDNTTNSTDLLILPHDVLRFTTPRIDTQNTHGTGCTLSAAIASYLAQGYSLTKAVKAAKHYISNAIAHADELQIGSGHGPVHHFFNQANNK
ncbi:bifunctional hydroxymethylpyrimidine kinase/phosphomethylpyrimidine kinase, partial [Photobacterium damselae]